MIFSREGSDSHAKQSNKDVAPMIDEEEVATGQRMQLASTRKNPESQMHFVAPTLFVIEPLQSALLQLAQRLSSTMIESTGQIFKQELPSGEVKESASHSEQNV